MRVLGRVRLSRFTEESTSIERQRNIIQQWAQANGHVVVAWAEDIEVSGSISPFDAPELGQYFKGPLKDTWDILCSWKLDRIARTSIGLHKVFAWMQENDKQLVCVADNIDLSSWTGRLVASVIAGVAEGELEAIGSRIRSGREELRNTGRWDGGLPPFGYRPVPREGGGYVLDKDENEFKLLRNIIDRVFEGESCVAIAKDLNERGVPSPKASRYEHRQDAVWHEATIRNMLRSKSMLGWTLHKGKPVLDDQGQPILKMPPAMELEEYNRLQAVLDKRSWTRKNPTRTAPLREVLKCWYCGTNLHIKRTKLPSGIVNSAYRCKKGCKQISINNDVLLPIVYEQFEQELGDFHIMEREYIPPTVSVQQLEEARATYSDLVKYIATVDSDEARKQLFEQLDVISKRIEELKAVEDTKKAPTVLWKETDRRYIDEWNDLDEEGKRLLMVKAGITVRARQLTKGTKAGPGIIESEFIVPEDLKARLRSQDL